ncbi:MAG: hypothetical protein HFH34_14195 [Eubacterium sp.]|nr:hypothetical protein [Eubacterium sp.]
MIVSFLCLIGPGAVTCLLRARSVREDRGENGSCVNSGFGSSCRMHTPAIFILLKVLAYAVIHMAVTIVLLHPLGEAEMVVLPNGMPSVRYGPAAMGLSVTLAVAAGLWGQQLSALKIAGRSRSIVIYVAAAAVAVALLVFPAGSSPAQFQTCTIPVKLNHEFYEDTMLLRASGEGEPQYFISLRTLSKGLGLDYGIEKSGLFRVRYYLGNTAFSVNRMTPGGDYCLRGEELFISLACLRGEEPFADIRVQDDPVLADGSSREIIYIEYDPKRFDPGWAAAADSSGGQAADGTIIVSPAQDFAQAHKDGCIVFSMDLQIMTNALLKNSVRLLETFPDSYLLLEVPARNDTQTEKWLRLSVQTVEKTVPGAADRIIPMVSDKAAFDPVMRVYHWKDVVFHLQDMKSVSERDIIDFIYEQGIRTVAVNAGSDRDLLTHELLERGVRIVRFQDQRF